MKKILISLIFLVALMPLSKAQDEDVYVNADQETDFSQYKTFYWSPALDDTQRGDTKSMDTAQIEKMKKTIAKKMEDMGYTLQEENPDLSVNFYMMVQDTASTSKEPEFPELGYSFWWGPDWYNRGDYWNGWDFWVNGETHWFYGNPTFYAHQGVDTEAPEAPRKGTLFIDIIDNKKNMLVWEGYINNPDGEEKASEENEENMEQEVSALLDKFPAEGEDQG